MLYSRHRASAFTLRSDVESTENFETDCLYIANLETSVISIIDGVGIAIWNLLEEPIEDIDLIAAVAQIFGETSEVVAEGTLTFLEHLQESGFVEIQ
ncbi:PqqD family protein [Rothia sp. ZJ932]|uniref:PqqD family protein n=1 Tax=Rothia sp. ZJ932 TaxID=2810516 RepID=UPI002102C95F|nr:PqqD family protein [Rothia sp. ZJ932]